MNLRMFGIGVTNAIAGEQTEGVVTEVKTCWWLKVNTKSIRAGAMDGAMFPHIFYFIYTAYGRSYQGKRYVSWNKRCPQKGEKLTVYYEKDDPAKYAVIV